MPALVASLAAGITAYASIAFLVRYFRIHELRRARSFRVLLLCRGRPSPRPLAAALIRSTSRPAEQRDG